MSKKMYVFKTDQAVVLVCGDETQTLFSLAEYNDVLNNTENSKYDFFDNIKSQYKIKTAPEIKDKFLYLFNFILVNNLANYIIDQYQSNNFEALVFDSEIQQTKRQIIKLTGTLDITDVLGDLIICLINSDEYLSGKVKIDYGEIIKKDSLSEKSIKLAEMFRYTSSDVKQHKEKLNDDLIAFKYVKPSKMSDSGRFLLPVYLDVPALIDKGIENYEDYLVNWLSLAYLRMLIVIHDYFVDYYKLDYSKGLQADSLMIALIDLLEATLEDLPLGLQKSIEVGRETSGKCFFINGVISPVSLPQELALILQARDAFLVVPKIFRSSR